MNGFLAILNKRVGKDRLDLPGRAFAESCLAGARTVQVDAPCFLFRASLGERERGEIWREASEESAQPSLIITYGWCYRIGSGRSRLSDQDYSAFMQAQRAGKAPDLDVLSGTFCLLSYDSLSQTLWIYPDMWAQRACFYGATADYVVVSSRAGLIADLLGKELDGFSYVSLLRGCETPYGRTLFSNIWRSTPGRAVFINLKDRTAKLVQVQPLFKPIQKLSFNDALDSFTNALRIIPQAASEAPTCVDLTGGNDSRITLAALSHAYKDSLRERVTFRVTGAEDHPDARTAQRLAELLGLNLVRTESAYPLQYSPESMLQAAILSDGKHFIPLVLNRLKIETELFNDKDYLLGSIGGELFRDYFWRHEFLRLGMSKKVNFEALLKHRIYSSSRNEISCITNQRLVCPEHDNALLQPYRDVVALLPDVTNVYKLDRLFNLKVTNLNWIWIMGDYRRIALPYLTHEITSLSMSLPWRMRLGRKLILTAIQRLEPRLCSIPADDGAIMEPLSMRNIHSFLYWWGRDYQIAYVKHFGRRKLAPQGPSTFQVDPLCLEIANAGNAKNLYETQFVLNAVGDRACQSLPRQEYVEFQALLLTELLLQAYPNVRPRLAFDCPGANFRDAVLSL